MSDGLFDGAETQLRQQFPHLLGHELEEGLHELGLAAEPGAQLRILGGDTHRAGVEVTDPHHDAAADH